MDSDTYSEADIPSLDEWIDARAAARHHTPLNNPNNPNTEGEIATACGFFAEAMSEAGIEGEWDVAYFPITREVRVELVEEEEEDRYVWK